MDAVNHMSDLLSVHADRDKIVCLASYVLKLWGATSNKPALLTASGRLAAARATLRLFDDAAALKNFLSYGLGKQDGPVWGTLGVAGTSSHLLYLQAEKLVWLADCGLIQLPKELDKHVRTAHKLFWVLSSVIGFIRSLRGLNAAAKELKTPSPRKCTQARFTQASLLTTKLLFDIIHSVSWLPNGWLWGSRLGASQMGGVATLSAFTAVVLHYHGKRFVL